MINKTAQIWGEFQMASARTLTKDEPHIMCALGIVGEVYEFESNPTIDELGDVAFYVVGLCTGLNIKVSEALTSPIDDANVTTDFRESISVVAELIKKYRWHRANNFNVLVQAVSMLVQHFEKYIVFWDFNPKAVFDYNVKKLRNRYPNGFQPLTKN